MLLPRPRSAYKYRAASIDWHSLVISSRKFVVTAVTIVVVMSAAVATPKKAAPAKKAKKAVAPAIHPKYPEMIAAAIGSLKERGGSSRQAILKYILKQYNFGKNERVVNQHLKVALRAGAKNGTLKQSKGSGATGSFRLGDKAAPKKKVAAKKPKAAGAVVKKVKKAKSPKKAKKPKTPKKAKKPKSPAKAKKPKAAPKAKKPVVVKAAKKAKSPAKAKKAGRPKKVVAKKA